jgi:predicted nucleic acid-binding protein
VSVYLDASVLVAFFVSDPFSSRAESFVGRQTSVYVSDFAAVEFASAVARHVRVRRVTTSEARSALLAFDAWRDGASNTLITIPQDMENAAAILRRLDLNIRTGDALNIAIAMRLDATLATFDDRMAENARALGATVAVA